jgi:hypothetical protein
VTPQSFEEYWGGATAITYVDRVVLSAYYQFSLHLLGKLWHSAEHNLTLSSLLYQTTCGPQQNAKFVYSSNQLFVPG